MAVEPAKKRLFDHAPVDDDVVVRLLSAGWGADALLKDRLKSSQNVTYSARMPGGCKASVRATRCDAAVLRRIEAEVRFVCAMADAGVKGVCEPLPPGLQHDEDSGTAVVVCRWAGGAMCKYTDWRWATVEPLVKAQGRFLGRLHAASKAWRAANPAAAAAVQRWDELHDGILKGAASERLLSVESSPDHFGVIHGDINPSNYHVLGDDAAADVALDVFDWDQVRTCLYVSPPWGCTVCRAAPFFTPHAIERRRSTKAGLRPTSPKPCGAFACPLLTPPSSMSVSSRSGWWRGTSAVAARGRLTTSWKTPCC